MNDADVPAMAMYLGSLRADCPVNADPAIGPGRASVSQLHAQGKHIYHTQCASRHGSDGMGCRRIPRR